MRRILAVNVILLIFLCLGALSQAQGTQQPDKTSYNSNQVLHPEWFLRVTNWSFFAPARVAMLSSVKIENTADIAYKDIKIRLLYASYTNAAAGIIATDTTVLPITVPPNSNNTYLKGGIPIGAGKQDYRVTEIQVLTATPIEN